MQEFTRQTDMHHRTIYTADSLNLWVSFYCDFYGAVMLAAVCLFAVGMKDRGASVVGLAFSNTIQVCTPNQLGTGIDNAIRLAV